MGAKPCTLRAGSLCLNLLKLVQVASPCAFGLGSAQTGPAALLGLILCLNPHLGSRETLPSVPGKQLLHTKCFLLQGQHHPGKGDKRSPVDEPQPVREQTCLQKEISQGERSRRKRGNLRESLNISSHNGAPFLYFNGLSLAPSHCG